MAWLGKRLPGLALAAGLGAVATIVAEWIGVNALGYEKSPVSPILLTVVLGLSLRNLVGFPEVYEPGLQLCVKRILRIGVGLLGVRLSLAQAGSTGLVALPIVLGTIASALLVVTGLNRFLGLPRRLGTLIAVGTSICGITAIVAIAPVIAADEDETSYAVATIAVFGMVALFAYPFIAHLLFADPYQAGLFLGTAIHDTSQVAGAGLTYQQQFAAPEALNAAVVTKLVRNLFMIGVIPLMGILYHRQAPEGSADAGSKGIAAMIPLFIVGFLVMTLLRTVGDLGEQPFGVLQPSTWSSIIAICQQAAELGLLLAMAAVGLGTSLKRLRILGLKPLSVGLSAAVCVGIVSYALIQLLVALSLV